MISYNIHTTTHDVSMIKRIGFACKWIDRPDQCDGIKPKDDCAKYNTGTTTRAWMNRQSRTAAEDKLWTLTKDNIESVRLLVDRVSKLDPSLRMVRLSSEILPLYTEKDWRYFYRQSDVVAYMERHFATIGEIARERNVRLSFHPGQFTVLASENPEIVNNSIEEFEYHATMARWMGYGKKFQDFKINVHISGKRGPEGIIEALGRLSPEARNCITIENDENCWGIDSSLELSGHCALVLDVHHHWVRTGEYIQPADDRCLRVIDSWRGVRPVIHYSQSLEEYLVDHSNNARPTRDLLIESGISKQKLRAHSDFYHNVACNDWALSHWEWADIMCESKGKNLASFKLHEYSKTRNENI